MESTALTRAEVIGVIETLLDVIPDELSRGNIVSLGEFGSFKVGIKTEGIDAEIDFTTNNILKTKVKFVPGVEFKEKIATFKFEKITDK
ncbi:MAG: HU family DNA-binding protein [Candidatus Cloacimonetes bacterium]|nr:HU family DNA-binding protein [Candidatus Cloacimonadota bacterium]